MILSEYVSKIGEFGLAPKNIEISKWNSWSIVSCYSEISEKYISESVSMGIDKNLDVALAKALTEFLERTLGHNDLNDYKIFNMRSDGFAAYPVYTDLISSQAVARRNALNEAIERFVWSNWWDYNNIYFEKSNIISEEIEFLKKDFLLKNVIKIEIPTNLNVSLVIFLAERINGGYITGGAAGHSSDQVQVHSRAFGELLRHLLAVSRIENNSTKAGLSFYEERLWRFASGEWNELVQKRLAVECNGVIELPSLIVDNQIIHKYTDLVSIHRCYFDGQSDFIGGQIDRLCI